MKKYRVTQIRTLVVVAWLVLAIGLAGCAPIREASAPAVSSPPVVARDGGFSYRIPPGWLRQTTHCHIVCCCKHTQQFVGWLHDRY